MHQPQDAPEQGQAGVHRQADGGAVIPHQLQHRVADGLPVLLAEDHHLLHVERLHLLQLSGQRHVGLDTLLQDGNKNLVPIHLRENITNIFPLQIRTVNNLRVQYIYICIRIWIIYNIITLLCTRY